MHDYSKENCGNCCFNERNKCKFPEHIRLKISTSINIKEPDITYCSAWKETLKNKQLTIDDIIEFIKGGAV